MNITNYGHFTTEVRDSILYHFSDDGVDWYELRKTLTTWGERGEFIDAVWPAWAMVDPDTMRVTNVEFDPSRLVPDNKIVLGIDVPHTELSVGMIYDGGTLLPAPPPPVPPLDRLTFWLVAARAGISKWTVRNHIEAMPDGPEKFEAIAWFEEARQYRRDDPLLVSLAEAAGISSEQLDALWASATIEA